MKIKEVEEIVKQNIEKREKEIGRIFTEKEKAIAILNEQLKIMEFDPAYFWGIKSEIEIHNETMQKISTEDIGEIEVSREGTCKILSIVYKYIANKYDLNVVFKGREKNWEESEYKNVQELRATTSNEHIYAVVKLRGVRDELKIDVQDEEQAMTICALPRNLGVRDIPGGLYAQQKEELTQLLKTIGYIEENQEFTNDYTRKITDELEFTRKTDYEKIKTVLEDSNIQDALKNAGVVASYKFYKDNLKRTYTNKNAYYLLPCYIKRQANDSEQISYSYFLFINCNEKQEIYMHSRKQGGLIKVEPQLVQQMLNSNLRIGHGDFGNTTPETIEGTRKLKEYINQNVISNEESEGEISLD